MLKFLASTAIILVAVVLLLPFKDGSSVSAAARNAVIEQIPPAIDILAQRHPLQIGIARAALNQDGQFDNLAKSYLGEVLGAQMDESPSLLRSYGVYYTVLFDKADVRVKIADSIEQQLGLSH